MRGKKVTIDILTFKITDNAPYGEAFIKRSYDAENVFDAMFENVALELGDGAIEVIEPEEEKPTMNSDETKEDYVEGFFDDELYEKDYIEEPTEEVTDDLFDKIIFTIGKKEALVFGKTEVNDVAPVIKDDRTMLPAKFVAEKLGAKVKWDNDKRQVIITK